MRECGILLPISSLPSPYGIGAFSKEAYEFVDVLAKSGVKYVAEPGGSVRDDNVIETCNQYGIAMAFTGMRLFHH